MTHTSVHHWIKEVFSGFISKHGGWRLPRFWIWWFFQAGTDLCTFAAIRFQCWAQSCLSRSTTAGDRAANHHSAPAGGKYFHPCIWHHWPVWVKNMATRPRSHKARSRQQLCIIQSGLTKRSINFCPAVDRHARGDGISVGNSIISPLLRCRELNLWHNNASWTTGPTNSPTNSPGKGLQLAMILNPLDLGNLINALIRYNK